MLSSLQSSLHTVQCTVLCSTTQQHSTQLTTLIYAEQGPEAFRLSVCHDGATTQTQTESDGVGGWSGA